MLLSGGDPLILPQRVLESLLRRLRAISHMKVVRIGTRVPVFLPQRVTPDLVEMLRRYHPLWMNIHFNHPKEITPEVEGTLALLADAGIPLGSQTVLLAGINDCPNVILALVHKLVWSRSRFSIFLLADAPYNALGIGLYRLVSDAPWGPTRPLFWGLLFNGSLRSPWFPEIDAPWEPFPWAY